jgi:hypothetical protein
MILILSNAAACQAPRMILILSNAAACLPSLRTRIILSKAAAWGRRPASCLGAVLTVWGGHRVRLGAVTVPALDKRTAVLTVL